MAYFLIFSIESAIIAKGLWSRLFRSPQPFNGLVIKRIDSKVESANALYRNNLSRPKQPRSFSDYMVGSVFIVFPLLSVSQIFGPQAAQATGWAWKRRSVTSLY